MAGRIAAMRQMSLFALPQIPMVRPGDDIAGLIRQALDAAGLALSSGDILVIAQKIISKAEGRCVRLADISPTPRAVELAAQVDKDSRLVELILRDSREVVRSRPGVLIVEHELGYIHANAGIDRSNVDGGEDSVLLLPLDSDASAETLRTELSSSGEHEIGIIINDSAGRAWREGAIGFALGTAGIEPLVDLVGKRDLMGRPMEVTSVAVADELAAAASVLMGQADEGLPVVHVRGFPYPLREGDFNELPRDEKSDFFR
mgnify:CR=1 FL=1